MTTASVHAPTLYHRLRDATHHGATAARLIAHTPDLIPDLTPGDTGEDTCERATRAEGVIRAAIASFGGHEARALEILFALVPGTLTLTLHDRRELAAAQLGIGAETFRRPHREHAMIWDLTMQLYRDLTRPHQPG